MWTFVSKVMSLPFTTLPRSFPSKKQVSFNFMAAVTIYSDFGGPPPKIKSLTVFIVSQSICHEVTGSDAMMFVF